MNANIAVANHIRDQRLITKTKKSYLGRLHMLRKFLRLNGYGDTLLGINGEILLHLRSIEDQNSALNENFGWLATFLLLSGIIMKIFQF